MGSLNVVFRFPAEKSSLADEKCEIEFQQPLRGIVMIFPYERHVLMIFSNDSIMQLMPEFPIRAQIGQKDQASRLTQDCAFLKHGFQIIQRREIIEPVAY